MARQVTCVTKHDCSDPYERITHIGGKGWTLTQQEAIRRINTGSESFYIKEPSGDPAVVVAGISADGKLHLRTTTDGDLPSKLLSLPECS